MAVSTNGTLLANRYRVVRRLGSGGAATVLLCEDQRLGRLVAVKRLHTGSPDEMERRLHREARLGASLNHPNLVSVFDTETYDEGVLVVMEYVEGETLRDALKRGPLPLRRSLEILRALASALDHAHVQGIVHRDVKPANVLLGPAGTVKLADLGIGIAADDTRLTRTGMALGTPAYMAPEQLEGQRVTAAADVYSLGAVAFELLSGRRAHEGDNPIEVARRATGGPPPDLRDAWPGAPAGAAQAIQRAMALRPSARQATAGELADDLQRALVVPSRSNPRSEALTLPLGGGRGFPRWLPVLALFVVIVAAALALLTRGGDGGTPKHRTAVHHRSSTKPKPKAAASQTQQSTPAAPQTTTPPSQQPQGADLGRQLNDQGKALIDAGRPDEAIPILERALAAFPPEARATDINYAYTLYNLADAYFQTGQFGKAIPLLQQRLTIPNQQGVVRRLLEQALQGGQ
ncbi:MAG: serine/threonine-protein kinase [Thermoleophilaceae bacterium]